MSEYVENAHEAPPPDVTLNADTLGEHVVDCYGLVWRIVRDGGMATRAHGEGVVSIGIRTLQREYGPLRAITSTRVWRAVGLSRN